MNNVVLGPIGPLKVTILLRCIFCFTLLYIYLYITAALPTGFRVFPNISKENQSITLSCSADVGAPNGNIKIWKLAKNSNVTELIVTSNTSDYNAENCTKFVNVTFSYTVSRDENGATFLCSSQNILNKGVGPSLESKISVKCKFKIVLSCLKVLHIYVSKKITS